ncbi:hypothetical protein [Mesorhizobium sp. M8A.F.Ca.ET.021.01.1.1]|uniref:hypothetical protein n=1 Tax=Mesorhizobium sp. M8A.F.Ca.ET.021.01.1.1 TaxID=2496757 RepID=UPI0032AFCFBC
MEILVEGGGKLILHRQIIVEGRDVFERTGDGIVEIGVEGRFNGRHGLRGASGRMAGGDRLVIGIRHVQVEIVVE